MHGERQARVDNEGRQETWIDWFAWYMKNISEGIEKSFEGAVDQGNVVCDVVVK